MYMYCILKFEVRNVCTYICRQTLCPIFLFLDRGGEKDFSFILLATLLFICSPFFLFFLFFPLTQKKGQNKITIGRGIQIPEPGGY